MPLSQAFQNLSRFDELRSDAEASGVSIGCSDRDAGWATSQSTEASNTRRVRVPLISTCKKPNQEVRFLWYWWNYRLDSTRLP